MKRAKPWTATVCIGDRCIWLGTVRDCIPTVCLHLYHWTYGCIDRLKYTCSLSRPSISINSMDSDPPHHCNCSKYCINTETCVVSISYRIENTTAIDMNLRFFIRRWRSLLMSYRCRSSALILILTVYHLMLLLGLDIIKTRRGHDSQPHCTTVLTYCFINYMKALLSLHTCLSVYHKQC